MKPNVRIVSPEVLMEPLLSLMEETEAVPLVVSGSSMTPFLVHGRDTVLLSKIRRPLKKGDVILYRRISGAYVLHRICRVEGDRYTLVGDAQTVLEPGIRREQILALVTAVERKGRLLRPGDLCWEFFERIWIRLIPLRPALWAAYSRIRK